MTAQDQAKSSVGFMLVHHSSSPAFAPHVLMNPVTYLGRQPGNDLVLGSENVSRRHAKLIVTDLGVTAHDLDSHNGIFLNGKKIRSAPVSPGDRLYVGDVCLELQRLGTTDAPSQSTPIHSDVSDEEDPRARSLAALMRIAGLCAGTDDGWAAEVVQVGRELVEAVVAAFVEVTDDGDFDVPILLQPEARRQGGPPIMWTAVKRVVESRQPLFSPDVVADGLVASVVSTDPRAVMAVPIVDVAQRVAAVLYLARGQATHSFTEVEFETLGITAQLIGMRLDRDRRGEVVTSVALGGAAADRVEALQSRIADVEGALRDAQARATALESQNQTLLEQAELVRSASGKDSEAVARLEATLAEVRKSAQRDVATAQKDLAAAQKELGVTRSDLANAREAHEATRAELGEARASRDAAGQRDVDLHRELDELRAARVAIAIEVDSLKSALTTLHGEHERLSKLWRDQGAELDATRRRADVAEQANEAAQRDATSAAAGRIQLEARLEALEHEKAAIAAAPRTEDALRQAMRTSVLPTVVDHVEAMASGESATTAAISRPVTAVYLALAEFDAWCERAPVDIVRRHLDAFCASVMARALANGGRLDQVIGHGHLLVFPADPGGARAAVRCALEVAAIVESDAVDLGVSNAPNVVAGIHSGTGVAGFFGDTDAVSYIEAGPPVVIARAAIDYAPKGPDGGARGVLVSESVRSALAGDVGFRITRLDPSWIRGINAPVQLALIDLDDGGGP